LSVNIFKTPGDGSSDFGASTLLPSKDRYLDWDLRKRQLLVVARDEFDKDFWKTDGKITSVVDLYGAQIFLHPTGSVDFELPGIPQDKDALEILREMSLKRISIDFGQGRSIWINGKQFKKSRYKDDSPVFSVILPKNETEFTKLATPDADDE
jgi:hypothetical protein